MTDKVFIDTNILVYAHDVTAGLKYKLAKDIINSLWESKLGCLSVQVLQEFFVVATQKVAKPLETSIAAGIIKELSFWRVHEPGSNDVLEAIELHRRYQISFWDAMVLQSAVQLNCSQIISEDLNPDQVYTGVTLKNPFI